MDVPQSKRLKAIDYNTFVICQEHNPRLKSVSPKDCSYFEKLLASMRCRHSYGDSRYMETLSAIECKTYIEFIVVGGFWYIECYKNVTHQTNINSLLKRFNKIKKSSDIPLISNVKLVNQLTQETLHHRNTSRRRHNKPYTTETCQEDTQETLHYRNPTPPKHVKKSHKKPYTTDVQTQ